MGRRRFARRNIPTFLSPLCGRKRKERSTEDEDADLPKFLYDVVLRATLYSESGSLCGGI